MCGIAGFLDQHKSVEENKRHLLDMLESIDHRGPDGSGIYQEGPLYLGHKRLAIIDLSKQGLQPKESNSERYVCSFNGEIYNFKEIRSELELEGYSFNSSSDTEVLLSLIDYLGFEKAIKRCVGMFAIALWDKKLKELKLARDRFGEKPLYYGWHKGAFIFGSELRSLIEHPYFEKTINSEALSLYFKNNYIKSPYSIYKDTYKLEAGKILTLNISNGIIPGSEVIEEYWSIENVTSKDLRDTFSGDFTEASLELEKLVKNSVAIQMQSDVPLGALLSGGVDSSLIVALMQDLSNKTVNTFSIGFSNTNFNEAHHAKSVAEFLGTNHEELYLSNSEVIDAALKMASIYDEPFSDSSQVPTYLVSKLARKKVTVSLSGDGGDELFFGYSKYLLADKISRVPFKNSIATLIKKFPKASLLANQIFSGSKRNISSDSLEFLVLLLESKNYSHLAEILATDRFAQDYLLTKSNEYKSDYTNSRNLDVNFDVFEAMMFFDRKMYLADDILTKVDRASMAVSLENRVPLLDHRILEFSATLPKSFLYKDGIQKRILKDVLYRQVPKELIDRPKAGFSPPISDWLKNDLKDWAGDLLYEDQADNDFINLEASRELFKDHIDNKKDNSILLWKILMFQDWKRQWL